MAAPEKVEQVESLKQMLAERSDFVMTAYSGLTVGEINDLRSQVRSKDARYKVVKNNLFFRALKEAGTYDESVVEASNAELKGPVAIAFTGSEELPSVAKVLVDFAKKNNKVVVKAGCLEGKFLDGNEMKMIASLPSKSDLLTIIARGLNAPAQKIAVGMNEIISGLARGIKQVGEKNG